MWSLAKFNFNNFRRSCSRRECQKQLPSVKKGKSHKFWVKHYKWKRMTQEESNHNASRNYHQSDSFVTLVEQKKCSNNKDKSVLQTWTSIRSLQHKSWSTNACNVISQDEFFSKACSNAQMIIHSWTLEEIKTGIAKVFLSFSLRSGQWQPALQATCTRPSMNQVATGTDVVQASIGAIHAEQMQLPPQDHRDI